MYTDAHRHFPIGGRREHVGETGGEYPLAPFPQIFS